MEEYAATDAARGARSGFLLEGMKTPGSTLDVRPGAIFFDPLRGLFLIGLEHGKMVWRMKRGERKQSGEF
jgi:hypothetical protein